MRLILASTSRYRAALLERLGLPFETTAPGTDETPIAGEGPSELVERLSREKAESVASKLTEQDALIVGSDQVAVLDELVLGKPGTPEVAREQLARLSGREVRFLTGLCLINAATGSTRTRVVTTPVRLGFADGRSTSHYRPVVDSLRIAAAVLRARQGGMPWLREPSS